MVKIIRVFRSLSFYYRLFQTDPKRKRNKIKAFIFSIKAFIAEKRKLKEV